MLSVTFAEHTSKTAVRPEKLDYPLDLADVEISTQWVEQLLQKAYGGPSLPKFGGLKLV